VLLSIAVVAAVAGAIAAGGATRVQEVLA
jgi:hypothetical protein